MCHYFVMTDYSVVLSIDIFMLSPLIRQQYSINNMSG